MPMPMNTSQRRHRTAATADAAAQPHVVRWGLAFKFAVPVALLQAVALSVWGLIVLRDVRENQLNETVKAGLTAVKFVHARGESLLRERERFRRQYPEYEDAPGAMAIPFDAHWLVASGEVSPERWSRLTGVTVGEPVTKLAATRAERAAAVLAFVTQAGRLPSEVLSAYVIAAPEDRLRPTVRRYIAASDPVGETSRFDEVDWMGLGDTDAIDTVRIARGDESIRPVRIRQGTLSWPDNNTRPPVHALQFFYPIIPAGHTDAAGDAVVALRADVILNVRRRTGSLMFFAGSVAVVLSGALCFVVGNQVTRPVRRLSRDMEEFSAGAMHHRTTARSQDEIGLLAAGFNDMAARLEVALGREKQAARMETELNTARDIQTSLLPPRVPFVRGYDIAAFYRPAREIGGDYYDFLPINGNHIGFIVADVSGKSIPGALVMTLMRATLRFFVPGNLSAADTLKRTNAFLANDIKRGMFVSAFYLILDVQNRRALCASAGHNPMVLCRADGTIETVSPGGIALGFDKGPVFNRTIKEGPVMLSSGDRVVLYTDGVVESMNAKNEEYGDERFQAFVRDTRELTSREFVDALTADLDAHQGAADQHDDITIVTFRVD